MTAPISLNFVGTEITNNKSALLQVTNNAELLKICNAANSNLINNFLIYNDTTKQISTRKLSCNGIANVCFYIYCSCTFNFNKVFSTSSSFTVRSNNKLLYTGKLYFIETSSSTHKFNLAMNTDVIGYDIIVELNINNSLLLLPTSTIIFRV